MEGSIKKNTPKGALCKYSNSLELTFTKLNLFDLVHYTKKVDECPLNLLF